MISLQNNAFLSRILYLFEPNIDFINIFYVLSGGSKLLCLMVGQNSIFFLRKRWQQAATNTLYFNAFSAA